MQGVNQEGGPLFRVESSNGVYESRVLAVAIGIFGRPNKPKQYRFDLQPETDISRGACATELKLHRPETEPPALRSHTVIYSK